MVIWVTGISGAGKTSLCDALAALLKPRLPELVLIDGDIVRRAFGHDLGYVEPDRVKQVQRLQSIASVLTEQNLVVLVAVLYSHPDLLAWNRRNWPDYFEIYLKVSLETVRARDSKGLYAAADGGRMPDVVGIDIPWHAPDNADMVIDSDRPEPPQDLARHVAARIPRLAEALGPSPQS